MKSGFARDIDSRKQGSSSFLKKRTKKLLLPRHARRTRTAEHQCLGRGQKFFGSFFQKRTASSIRKLP
jgi:hypothetical protein